jgi:hypothetical protein
MDIALDGAFADAQFVGDHAVRPPARNEERTSRSRLVSCASSRSIVAGAVERATARRAGKSRARWPVPRRLRMLRRPTAETQGLFKMSCGLAPGSRRRPACAPLTRPSRASLARRRRKSSSSARPTSRVHRICSITLAPPPGIAQRNCRFARLRTPSNRSYTLKSPANTKSAPGKGATLPTPAKHVRDGRQDSRWH